MSYYNPKKARDETVSEIHNPKCDGDHCRDNTGIVKVYPLGAGGNLILCHSCWAHENRYRFERGRETGEPQNWPQRDWYNNAEVYDTGREQMIAELNTGKCLVCGGPRPCEEEGWEIHKHPYACEGPGKCAECDKESV